MIMLRFALCLVASVSATSRPLMVGGKDMALVQKEITAKLSEQEENLLKLSKYTFEHFVKDFKRMYSPGSDEWKLRETTFKKNLQAMQEHHSGPAQPWSVGVNKFMDYSEAEFNRLLGYKGAKKGKKPTSFIQSDLSADDVEVPTDHTWLTKMPKAKKFVKDQGACGSCWAVAAATAMEGHLEIRHGDSTPLSTQFLVSCVPNPQQCGGTGGCQGATAEMAYKYVKENGIPSESHWPYMSFTGSDGSCNPMLKKLRHASIESFVQLPENKAAPLLQALYQHGPVVVSADASDWSLYNGGVFAGCDKDAVINHAITAEGFGEEFIASTQTAHKYYLIRNSWGKDWGEHGYIRLARFDDEAAHCGIDHKPEEGTGCLGGPSQVKVCGMCGVLYDSTHPVGASFVHTSKGGTYAGKGESQNPVEELGNLFKTAFQ